MENEHKSKTQGITVKIGGNADELKTVLDELQVKADKLEKTLENIVSLNNSINTTKKSSKLLFGTRKKIKHLENEIANIKRQTVVDSYDYGKITLKDLVRKMPQIVKKYSSQDTPK